MNREFYLALTFWQVLIVVIVYALFLIFIAYKKPTSYKLVIRVFTTLFIAFMVFSMAWQSSMEYHKVPLTNQTSFPDHLTYIPFLIIFIDFLWLRSVVKKRIEEGKDTLEEN